MKIKLTERERELLGFGLQVYERNGKAAIGTLTGLGVSTTPVTQALDNCETVKQQLATAGVEQEVTLTIALRQCARQALALYQKRVTKVKEDEEQIKIMSDRSDKVLEEVDALARRFDDQIDLDEASRGG